MLSGLSYVLPLINGVLPPLFSVVALLLTGGLKFRDIRGSTYNRNRILNHIARYDSEFSNFVELLYNSDWPKYSDLIEVLPAFAIFVIITYYSIEKALSSPIIFIILVFSTIFVWFFIVVPISPFRPKFVQRVSPVIKDSDVKHEDKDLQVPRGEETSWRLENHSAYIYTLMKACLNVPFGIIVIVYGRVLWDGLLFFAISTSQYLDEFIYSIIVFFSTFIFLFAYLNARGHFSCSLEDRIYKGYKEQTKCEVEPEIEITVSSTLGTLFRESGKMSSIGLEMELTDLKGYIYRFQWKDIIHVGTRRK